MARDFDHNNANYLERTSTNLGMNGLTELSIAAWINIDNVDAALNTRVCCKGVAASALQTVEMELIQNTTTVQVIMESGTDTPNWTTNAGIGLDTWTRILFTWKRNAIDATDGIWYVNGSSVAATFAGTYTAGFTLTEDSNIYTIGNAESHNRPFDGLIAYVTIWNRQLTAAEALADAIDPLAVQSGMISCVPLCPDGDIKFGGSMTITGTVPCIAGPKAAIGQLLSNKRHQRIVL